MVSPCIVKNDFYKADLDYHTGFMYAIKFLAEDTIFGAAKIMHSWVKFTGSP